MNRLQGTPRAAVASVMAVAVLLMGCAVNRSEKTPEGAPLARQLTQSDHCGLTAPGLVYLESADDVERLSRLPTANLPLDSLKAVDFEREHLILVGLGQKPTGGFGVTLEGSVIHDSILEVDVALRQPAADAMVTQVLTTPCAVIAVTPDDWESLSVSGAGMETLTRER